MIESYFAEPLPPVAHLVADSKDWVRVASGAQKTWHCNSWHMTPVFAATIVPLGVHWQKQAARNNAVRNARNRSITAVINPSVLFTMQMPPLQFWMLWQSCRLHCRRQA